jgi:threonine/homoserine/homoserine lactone efflux protein
MYMDHHTLITCLVAVTILTLTPGIDTILIIRNSARGGWSDGAVSSLGICSGLFVHALVSAFGISLILMQTAWAFSALKMAGAGYLIWLGLNSWRRLIFKKEGKVFGQLEASKVEFNAVRSFREGFLSNVLNPKTVIFYMAFLPQFIDPVRDPLSQSMVVAGIHFTIAMIWQCLLASMVDRAKVLLQRPKFGQIFDGLTGSVMLYLGSRLVLDD